MFQFSRRDKTVGESKRFGVPRFSSMEPTYFAAFRAAAIRAQQSILILGWDFDSRTRMLVDQEPDGFP